MARSDGRDLIPEKRLRLLELQPELAADYVGALPPGVLLFRCRVCGTVYPLNHFARNDQRRYGIRADCRRCRSAARSEARFEPEDQVREKYCTACRQSHPVQAFSIDRTQPGGYSSWCREAANQRRQGRADGRRWTEVAQKRREQTILLCGELGIDHPGYDVKQCRQCRRVKHVDEFGNDRTRADRKHCFCLDCRAALV